MLIDLHTHTHPPPTTPFLPHRLPGGPRGPPAPPPPRPASPVTPAIEVNTEDGHLLAFGIDRYVYGMHRVAELARLVEEAGGVLVAAHPYRRQLPFHLRPEGDWSEGLARA